MANNNFGFEIKNLRHALGLTQEQFARKLGVTFPTVNRWENKKSTPSPLAQQKLKKMMNSNTRLSNPKEST